MADRDAVSALAALLARLGIHWTLIGALAANYEREAIGRSRVEEAGSGAAIRVLAAEDVILLKLIAGRAWDVLDSWLQLRSASRR